MKRLKVLIACEESQRVCLAFRERGFEAYSADIQEPSGGHPEYHILGDVLGILSPRSKRIKTMDGKSHFIKKWDLIIAHPPCTYLTVSGNRWFNVERYGDTAIRRYGDREKAAEFFMAFVNADCEHIAIENPIGFMNTHYREADEIIQPYEFGHPARKATCLWLKNLPALIPTDIVKPEIKEYTRNNGGKASFSIDYCLGGKERQKNRSKTYPGIAAAMAQQWGDYLLGKTDKQLSLFEEDADAEIN